MGWDLVTGRDWVTGWDWVTCRDWVMGRDWVRGRDWVIQWDARPYAVELLSTIGDHGFVHISYREPFGETKQNGCSTWFVNVKLLDTVC